MEEKEIPVKQIKVQAVKISSIALLIYEFVKWIKSIRKPYISQ